MAFLTPFQQSFCFSSQSLAVLSSSLFRTLLAWLFFIFPRRSLFNLISIFLGVCVCIFRVFGAIGNRKIYDRHAVSKMLKRERFHQPICALSAACDVFRLFSPAFHFLNKIQEWTWSFFFSLTNIICITKQHEKKTTASNRRRTTTEWR